VTTVVLDASVQVGWILPDEPWHTAALAVAHRIADGRLDAVVVPNSRFEICNALIKAARRGRIGWLRVAGHLAQLDDLSIRIDTEPFEIEALLAACRDHRLSWRDAHHALLARRLARPLLTADERLVRALRDSDIWVESILDRPADEGDQ